MPTGRRLFKLFLIAFVSLTGLGLQAKIANDTPVAIDPNVTIGRLPNGLTYYIRPNAKPENRVELRLVVNAGSILENDDQVAWHISSNTWRSMAPNIFRKTNWCPICNPSA